MVEDFERCYGAVLARDARFDGWFVTAVRTTRIYCRPSCPARTPARRHVTFYPSAAAAQQAGYRACKRCRPDAAPGSPEWNSRQDVAARAMRMIREGTVDRDGVAGLARHLGYSVRQLARVLTDEVGAGPLALARAQRSQTARVLLETSALPVSSVAFAAGFTSVRQFNDTVRQVFACTPTELRRKRKKGDAPAMTGGDALVLRLAHRQPYAATRILEFLSTRAIPGVETATAAGFARTLALPHGAAVVELTPLDDHVRAQLWLDDLRDLAPVVQRCRTLFDLDADPVAVANHLEADPVLGGVARLTPGMRLPGSVDAHELAVRAVIGQQVSVAAARRILTRLSLEHGAALASPHPVATGSLTHRFPDMARLAALDPDELPLPRRRAATVVGLAGALAQGSLVLDTGADAEATRASLCAVPGIGPWTAGYIAVRGLGHPDVLLSGDLGVQRAAARMGLGSTPTAIEAVGTAWRPWRSYAMFHMWGYEGTALSQAS